MIHFSLLSFIIHGEVCCKVKNAPVHQVNEAIRDELEQLEKPVDASLQQFENDEEAAATSWPFFTLTAVLVRVAMRIDCAIHWGEHWFQVTW